MRHLFSELFTDLTSRKCISAIFLGFVMGILLVVVEVSFAAMIFSGPMADFASRGAGLLLFGAVVMGGIIALTSSFRSVISTPQDAPVAVLASIGITLTASMSAASPHATFITMIAIMALSSLFTGIAFFLIGQFKLSNYFRFVPYPVIGGFLAGTGWFLLLGGVSVMCGISPSFGTLPQLFNTSALWLWGPGVLYAVTLWLVMKRWSHFLILPSSIVAMTALYYVAFHFLNISVDAAREAGILLSGVPSNGLWPVFSTADLQYIHWDVIATQLPIIGSVMLVTMLCLLLNVSGIEVSCGKDLNFNREFRFAGLANIIACLGGSSPGAHTMSLSLLCEKTGAYSRLTGLITALVIGGVLFIGGTLLEYFPLPLLGGMLFFLGLDMFDSWMIASRKKLPLLDYGILVTIFLVICLSGFLEGVAVGMFITVVIFMIRFSKVDVIAEQYSGLTKQSRQTRSVPIALSYACMASNFKAFV